MNESYLIISLLVICSVIGCTLFSFIHMSQWGNRIKRIFVRSN